MHLCIGQAYAFSTFNLPLTKLLGITQSAPSDGFLCNFAMRPVSEKYHYRDPSPTLAPAAA